MIRVRQNFDGSLSKSLLVSCLQKMSVIIIWHDKPKFQWYVTEMVNTATQRPPTDRGRISDYYHLSNKNKKPTSTPRRVACRPAILVCPVLIEFNYYARKLKLDEPRIGAVPLRTQKLPQVRCRLQFNALLRSTSRRSGTTQRTKTAFSLYHI